MKKLPKKFSYVFKSLIILLICIYGKIFRMIIWLGSAFLFMFMLWADFNIYLNRFIWTSH